MIKICKKHGWSRPARFGLAVLVVLGLIAGITGWRLAINNEAGINVAVDNSASSDQVDAWQNPVKTPTADTSSPDYDVPVITDNPSDFAADQSSGNPKCPIPLPEPLGIVNFSRGMTIETWKLTTGQSCADYARSVLKLLQPTGAKLLQAGYMDLSGECWGCTVRTVNDESINITLLPQSLFAQRGESNLLEVTVIKVLTPKGF